MFEAARVGDDIGHSKALRGMILGTVVGGLVAAVGGIAAGALITAGLAASCLFVGVLLVGAGLALGYATAQASEKVRNSIASDGAANMTPKGKILTGSPNVFINGRPAAIATDSQVPCSDHSPTQQIAEGSSRVYINGLPAARVGDKVNCGAGIMTGSANVIIGGDAKPTLPITPEVPGWLGKASDLTLLFAGLAGGVGGAASKGGALGRLLGKLPGIDKLRRIACRAGALLTVTAAVGIVARPVDIVSGQKFLCDDEDLDFVLPSRLPVEWQRCWRSGNPADSVLGRGWSLFWESWLEPYQDGLAWRAPSGDFVAFPAVPQGSRYFSEPDKRWLEHHHDGGWSVYDISGERLHYPALPAEGRAYLACQSSFTGDEIHFFRHDDGRLRELVDSAGQRVTCRYHDNGRLSGAWLDDDIQLAGYAYDEDGQLTQVTGRGGVILRRFTWRDGLMASHENADGLLCEYLWREIAGLPRVTAYRNSAGEQLNFHYDFDGGRREALRDDGARAVWLLDDDDAVAAFTDFDGSRTVMLHESGELCGVVLPGGAARRCEWDRYGRLLSETDPLARQTRYQWYRLSDRLTLITYPDGSRERREYDSRYRLTGETDALGHVTRYRYPDDDEALPGSVIDARGGEVRLEWSRQGRLTARTDCSGSVTRYDYDRFGQLTRSEDAEGNITRREWNQAGQLTAVIQPDGSRERFDWRGAGQLTAWTDTLGSVTRWRYNALGLPVSVTDRIGRERRYGYDPRGWLIELENGNGVEYRFAYDPAGRLTQETRPDGTGYRLTFDARGHLAERIDAGCEDKDGGLPLRVTRYHIDDAGLLAGYATDQAEWHCQRDAMGRLLSLMRTPTAAGVQLGIEPDTLTFRYDAAGQLLDETGRTGTLAFDYDESGNLTALTTPQQDRLSWLYYGSGHALGMRYNGATVTEFTRDRLHREIARTQGTLTQRRAYDAQGRRAWQSSVRGMDAEPAAPEDGILWRAFRYTGRGELAGVSDRLRGEIHFDYDPQGRLKHHSESLSGMYQAYRYDAADNLLDGEQAAPVRDNRLTRWARLFNRYDAWGNLTARRYGQYEQHYGYDDGNRLIRAWGTGPRGAFEAFYRYDALGRRIGKRVKYERGHEDAGEEETLFVWQGFRLLQELAPQRQRRRTYLYDPAEPWSPLARIDQAGKGGAGGERYWFHPDLNGAPLEVTDEEGAVRWSGQYGGWGEVGRQTVDSVELRQGKTVIGQPLRYAGQYADSETGLHYNLFRYFDPVVGRFTTQDPIGLAGGLNNYAYAPNPLTWIDPLGLAKAPCGGSPKDAQKKVNRGQGPKDIKRIDEPEESVPGSQWHAHQTKPEKGKNPALNQDGSTHDGAPSFSKKTFKWLKDHGWNVDDWL
ncbi:RHS repeat-associated core domain-containing protein [Brenneria goodwinii]|uniref:RHS repeat-associated core domain-containing protein n=1 Tax=Brenneria goodwinii TaxID=1109412 RepID=UPI0036E38DE6